MELFDLDFLDGDDFLAGVDEVGRGPLAGPVVGGCAFFRPESKDHLISTLNYLKELGVTDSKKLTAKKRNLLFKELDISLDAIYDDQEVVLKSSKLSGLSFRVYEIQAEEIDKINILEASIKAMRSAFVPFYEKYARPKEMSLLIDGNREIGLGSSFQVKEHAITKGDQKSVLIGLASIVAKEYRDELMKKASVVYPGFGFEKHAGYPTKVHKEMIKKLGPSVFHRKSFKGVYEYLQNGDWS